MEDLKAIYKEYREIILYLIFGGLTTLVNFVIYAGCRFFNIDEIAATVIAWIGAVLFAYLTNRGLVFQSQVRGAKAVIVEITAFYGARVFSLLVDVGIKFLMIKIMGINEWIVLVVSQVVVIVLNYILSKLIVFRKKKTKDIKTEQSEDTDSQTA